jgi:lipid-binding SYLF domain-containing protein
LDARIRGGCDWAEQAEHGGLDNSNPKTPVLIYSSTSGAYAGASLEGSKISTDDQTMRD